MTGAQVMSARSSQPPNTALIRAPRPNTVCVPVQPRHQHSVAMSLLSPTNVVILSSLSSPQPSRQVFHFCLSPHLFVYLNANLFHSASENTNDDNPTSSSGPASAEVPLLPPCRVSRPHPAQLSGLVVDLLLKTKADVIPSKNSIKVKISPVTTFQPILL